MRKVFIDIGGHIGQSVDLFFEQIEDACEWDIYCFEPLQYDNLIRRMKRYNNVVTIKAIVGSLDGEDFIYPVPLDGQGATSIVGKLTGDVQYSKRILVREIDFARWFYKEIFAEDFVLVKVNIEGGEYRLMKSLIARIEWINGLWIKLHHNKFEFSKKAELLEIYKQFQKEVKNCKAFIYCDITENPYDFKWLMEKACEK